MFRIFSITLISCRKGLQKVAHYSGLLVLKQKNQQLLLPSV
jgi:hypothetical protein